MNTDLENALRSIEVARTKLQLLSGDSADNADLTKLGGLLDQAHALLSAAPETQTQPAPPVDPTQIVADIADNVSSDFTLIKKIDPAMASSLVAAGINSFDDIANLQAGDVADLTAALSLGTRINHENWIEEAAILAKGSKTAYVRSLPPARPALEIPRDANMAEPTEPEPITPEPVVAEEITPEPVAPEVIPAEPEAPAAASPELVAASAAIAAGVSASIEDTPLEDTPIERATDAEPEAPEAPEVELVAADVAPPNDQREATIEIKPRTDSQLAYPNSDEDPDQVVKRFMRALTGDDDKDQ